jgi:cytoskeletal protein RodZ
MNKPTQPSTSTPGEKNPSAQTKEHIGEILKRAREVRGISIETLSKELKLNARYLQALEANDYDQLPGDTYIRVYLRSVCVYLSLNPDEILKRFFDEQGLTGVDTLRKDSSTKIDLMTVREKEKPGPMLYIVLALIAVVVAFAFIANSRGWFSMLPRDTDVDDQAQQTAPLADTAAKTPVLLPEVIHRTLKKPADSLVIAAVNKNNSKDTLSPKTAIAKKAQDSLAKVALRKLAADSARLKATMVPQPAKDSVQKALPPAAKTTPKDTAKAAIKTGKDTVGIPSVAKPKSDTPKAVKQPNKDSAKVAPLPAKPKKDSAKTAAPAIDSTKKTVTAPPIDTTMPSAKTTMKLRITAQNDSSYAVIYRDGIRSRNMFHSGRSMYFIARDSFNVTIGANENAVVTLDGKLLFIPGTGKVSFKVDASGAVTTWTEERWNSVFSAR